MAMGCKRKHHETQAHCERGALTRPPPQFRVHPAATKPTVHSVIARSRARELAPDVLACFTTRSAHIAIHLRHTGTHSSTREAAHRLPIRRSGHMHAMHRMPVPFCDSHLLLSLGLCVDRCVCQPQPRLSPAYARVSSPTPRRQRCSQVAPSPCCWPGRVWRWCHRVRHDEAGDHCARVVIQGAYGVRLAVIGGTDVATATS